MIPRAYITEWRVRAPWKTMAMVEQDLIINRALVDIFSDPFLKSSLVFRGGTALHKLFFDTPLRYSEDIDLVQKDPGPIGPIFDRIQERLGEWLGGRPAWKLGPEVVKLTYRFDSEDQPEQPLKFKIEINSREHFHVLPLEERRLEVIGRWFSGECEIPVYRLEELLATKLRALLDRRKGRDLFDLAAALRRLSAEQHPIVTIFQEYMAFKGRRITRGQFVKNLDAKLRNPGYLEDCAALLSPEETFNLPGDAELIKTRLLALLPDPVPRSARRR